MKKVILLSVICLLQAAYMSAQIVSSSKATVHINNKPKVVDEMPRFRSAGADEAPIISGKFYALIIGVNNYTDPKIRSLENPIRDAEKFYSVITTKYTFDPQNVKLLKDATLADIQEALGYFSKEIKSNDNFLIFYAGHGFWDPTAEVGYWLPSDARKNNTFTYFRNSTIKDVFKEIKSKHTLLISDACFSGSIFNTRSAFSNETSYIKKLYDLQSRQAMTSGTTGQEVPDESAFLKYLVAWLVNNNEKYLSSEQLFSSFKPAVVHNTEQDVPQFGVVQGTDDMGGDFIFVLRQ
jgi:uncharacterized caspase-like protein